MHCRTRKRADACCNPEYLQIKAVAVLCFTLSVFVCAHIEPLKGSHCLATTRRLEDSQFGSGDVGIKHS